MQKKISAIKQLAFAITMIGLNTISFHVEAGGTNFLPACADGTRCGNTWYQDGSGYNLSTTMPSKVLNELRAVHNWATLVPHVSQVSSPSNIPFKTHGAAICRVNYNGSQFIGLLRASTDNKATCVFADANGSQVLYSHSLGLPIRGLWMSDYNSTTASTLTGVIPISYKFIPYLSYTVNLNNMENTDQNFSNAWYATRTYGGAIPFLAGKRSNGSRLGICTAIDNNIRYLGSLDEGGGCTYVANTTVNNVATYVAKVGRAETFLAMPITGVGPGEQQKTITKTCVSTDPSCTGQ